MNELVKGPTRVAMERELAHYIAAINIDTQFAVRKCVFLLKCLAMPQRLAIPRALEELERRLTKLRAEREGTFGRPWSSSQLRKCYWASAKRFIRRPVMPMTLEEWKTYQPTMNPEQIIAIHQRWAEKRRLKARKKAAG